jgi:molybdopterin molybdotransferase
VQGWLRERGYAAPPPLYVADRREDLASALARALDGADLVLTTGGVSVGDRDYVPGVAEALGVRRVFWKVAQMPGKPLWFGVRGARALLAMPGNPAAVLVGLSVHVACALAALEGEAAPSPAWRAGVLEAAAAPDERRDRLVRMTVRYDDTGRARLGALPRQDSHMLSNLGAASALAWTPLGPG